MPANPAMQVFVRFNVSDQYCTTPVMQDRKAKRYHFGYFAESYPTSYSKRTLGAAVAWAISQGSVAQVEVKPAPNLDGDRDGS